jgi:predicted RecA/RadA family phage recombinase
MNNVGTVLEFKDNSSIIKSDSTSDIYAIRNVALPIGTRIQFQGEKIECITTPCYNIVDCYQVIGTPPCIMDKKGIVVTGTDGCAGRIFIQDTSSPNTNPQLYALRDSATVNGNNPVALKPGDIVMFGDSLTTNITGLTSLCNTVGVVTCYQVISTPPVCVMNKTGVVVDGIAGCTGQIFIQDTSSTNPNPQLYALRDSATVNSNNPVALKPGDIVMFGGYPTINVTGLTSLCQTVGVATCYEIISTPPACVMDKSGVVVAGTNGCTGQLFIEESTPYMSMIPRLYSIKNDTVINNSPTKLKAGDQVKFGGYLTPNDSSVMNSCHTIGVATCYQLVQAENVDTLMGTVNAGNAIAKTGLAILYKKGDTKATATYTITNGSFLFINLPKADYTVYIIPDINAYKNYLPTFYKNNFLFQNADYITLANTMTNVTVDLKSYVFPVGTGKIYGNIYFETYTLKDSLLVDSVQYKTGSIVVNNFAINTPVILLNSNGEPVAWTLTDEYGNYTFENIALDTYKILSETASAEGDSYVNLSPGSSTANTDLVLKGLQSYTGITNPENVVLSLYPNPVSDKLIVILKEAGNISIYNVMGQMLLNKKLNQGINVLDLSAINKDIYFARIGGTTIKLMKK